MTGVRRAPRKGDQVLVRFRHRGPVGRRGTGVLGPAVWVRVEQVYRGDLTVCDAHGHRHVIPVSEARDLRRAVDYPDWPPVEATT